MTSPLLIFLSSAVAGLATVAGMYLVIWNEERVRRWLTGLVSFGAGTLLAASFTELLPEAAAVTDRAFLVALTTFFLFYVLEHQLTVHNLEGVGEGPDRHLHHRETKARAAIAVAGIGLHSLIDGVIIGVGFAVSDALGAVALLAVLLHELPEGVATVSVLLHAGFSRRRALMLSWAVALATPLGTAAVLLARTSLPPSLLGSTLAVAAGSFLYVAGTDLIPEIHRELKWRNVAFVALGMLVPVVVESVIG